MTRFSLIAGWFAWTFVFGLLAGSKARGDQAALPTVDNVSIGFNGYYKTGFWNGVRLEITGAAAEFRGTLAISSLDGDGVPLQHVWGESESIVIAPQTKTVVEREVRFGRAAQRITVRLTDSSGGQVGRTFDLPNPLRSDDELILTWGPGIGIAEALGGRARSRQHAATICELDDPSQLPSSWIAYDSVDLFVLNASDVESIRKISEPQLRALRDWVMSGGRLIFAAGTKGEELLGNNGVLAEFAPGRFEQVEMLRSVTPLETYTGIRLPLSNEALRAGIPMSLLRDVRGDVELLDLAAGGERPMVVRAPLGFGQVVFTAFDLDQPPFKDWEGRPRFVNRLIRGAREQRDTGDGRSHVGNIVQFGYNDMAGQLRSSLDQFSGITLFAFSWVAGLLLLYIALIGPADYFLLRDLFHRLNLTWISFPLYVIGFVVLAVVLNGHFKGENVRVNHLDLVDIDEASSTVRGTTWVHVYSPRASIYDVAITPIATDVTKGNGGNLVSWQGLPGAALGGLDTNSPGGMAANSNYHLEFTSENVSQLSGVPMPVASTRSFVSRWWGKAELPERAKLVVDADGLLQGEIVNPLPVEITDCAVLFGNWIYRLDSRRGVLLPGERMRIESERVLNLQWRLTGRRVIDLKDVSTPWDQNTLDVDKILEMMMLYEAAGGESYTQLKNRYQPYIDLSKHLTTGRAILMARSKEPATKLQLGGAGSADSNARQWTYYRVVFPVEAYQAAR